MEVNMEGLLKLARNDKIWKDKGVVAPIASIPVLSALSLGAKKMKTGYQDAIYRNSYPTGADIFHPEIRANKLMSLAKKRNLAKGAEIAAAIATLPLLGLGIYNIYRRNHKRQ